ncbi:MAG: hypothetical protein ABJE95_00630 [Byssovorax sp.]
MPSRRPVARSSRPALPGGARSARERTVALLLSIGAVFAWAGAGSSSVAMAAGGGGKPSADAGAFDASDAEIDRRDAAGGEDLEALRARAGTLRRELDAVRTLIAGSLPEELYTTELFRVALLDEPAVEARRRELEREIAAGKNDLRRTRADAGDADDAGLAETKAELDRAIAGLALDLAGARLTFLRESKEQRAAVLDAEARHRRLAAEKEAAGEARTRAAGQERAAEEARKKALDEAESSREASQRALANERARAEGIRGAQATLRRELADAREALTGAERDHARTLFELADAARAAGTGSAEADALYEKIVAALGVARHDLAGELATYASVPPAPRYVPDPDAPPAGHDARSDLARSLDHDADELDTDRRNLGWDRLDAAVERVSTINAERLALIERLGADKRDEVLGVGDEGRRQFGREVDQVRLVTRWAWVSRMRTLGRARAALTDPLVLGTMLTRVLALIALIVLARTVRRRGPATITAARALLTRILRRRVLVTPLSTILAIVAALLGELLFLAVVLALPTLVGSLSSSPVLATLHGVLVAYAVYRLAIAAAHRGIARAASAGVAKLDEASSEKILRSVRVVGRYALAVTVFLVLSRAVLGRGYLYHLASRFAWLGAIPIAAVLIRGWRDDISARYLRTRDTGLLADAVRRTRERWYGFFVAVAAFLVVLASFVAGSARRFVLSFEQSRKALAYLFRWRLERRADDQAAPHVAAVLPAEVRDLLADAPVVGESYALDRFPGMDRFEAALATWIERGGLGALLVVGRTGYGKTSWLNAAATHAGEIPITRINLDSRPTAATLAATLAGPLGCDGAADLAGLAEALRAGPRRLLLLDDIQNFFQRGVGTLETWKAFTELVTATGDRVFWLAAIAHHPFEYLTWARRGEDVFRDVVHLPAWTEREIAALLVSRTQQTGWEPIYEDLIVDRIEGVDATQLLSTSQDYMRLIWDYAEGSPRVALHCWASSLVPEEGRRLRVRLFRRPEAGFLEKLDDVQKFILAGVIWHENVTAEEMVGALRFPRARCDDTIARLRERGVVREQGERYRITVHWWPAVIRYLRRKHLIET